MPILVQENYVDIKDVQWAGKHVQVKNMDFDSGEFNKKGSLILPNDVGKSEGIHPRWGQIATIGKELENPPFKVGDWALIEHGRWSRVRHFMDGEEVIALRMVDVKDIVAINTERPASDDLSVLGFQPYSANKGNYA